MSALPPEREARSAESSKKVEAVIGTDEDASANASSSAAAALNDLLRDTPPHQLADVAAHLAEIQHTLAAGAAAQSVLDFDPTAVADQCTAVEVWAASESWFPEQPSVLAECGMLDVFLPMLAHPRSPVPIAALTCLRHALRHPVQRKLAARFRWQTAPSPTCAATPVDNTGVTVLQLLFHCMRRFPNKEDLQALAIQVAQPLAQHDVEGFLVADVISAALAAMKAHPHSDAIQKAGVALFAALVDCARADPQDVPVAILFVNVGAVIDFLFAAHRAHQANTDIAAAVAHCLAVMSAFRENHDELIATDAVRVASCIVDSARHVPSAFAEAIATLTNLVPVMDTLQRRSVVLRVRSLMVKTADTRSLACCCALLRCIALSFEPTPPPASCGVDGGAGTETRAEQQRYAEQCAAEVEAKEFLAETVVPIISLALDHYGDVDSVLQQAASDALRAMVLRKWR